MIFHMNAEVKNRFKKLVRILSNICCLGVNIMVMRYWLIWMVGALRVSSSLIDVYILIILVFLLSLVVIDTLTVQPTFEWLWRNLMQRHRKK